MSDLEIRDYRHDDEDAVLQLLGASLEWSPDERYRAFFRWKHVDNPFGASAAWVAVAGERVVGFRTFLRWEFARGDDVVRAARAVDTATHPDHQGKGIFSRLTLHGLERLRDEGVSFVFNTPNDQSRPGYLKMGWQVVGRLPVRVRPRHPGALVRMLRARQPADRWSPPATSGTDPAEVLHGGALDQLLIARQPSDDLTTRRSADYLRWRYAGFAPLGYRAHLGAGGPADGVVIYRVRRRGAAREAVMADVLAPAGADRRDRAALLRGAVRESGADYGIGVGENPGLLPLPRQGPLLTWRGVSSDDAPPLERWSLSLGDTELF